MKLYRAYLSVRFTTESRALHLYLSPWRMLSWPTAISKRLRAPMRAGLWSALSVPGGGILIRVEPYCDAGQRPVGGVGGGGGGGGGGRRNKRQHTNRLVVT